MTSDLRWKSGCDGVTVCRASSYKIVHRPRNALKDIVAIHTATNGHRTYLYEGGRDLTEAKNICEQHHSKLGEK